MFLKSFINSYGSFVTTNAAIAGMTLAAFAGLAGTAAASTVYSDNFGGTTLSSSPGSLNGAASGGSTTWTSDSSAGWAANGTITTSSTSYASYAANLPFTPSSNEIYTLTETVDPTNYNTAFTNGNYTPWIGIAFNTTAPTTTAETPLNGATALMLDYYGIPYVSTITNGAVVNAYPSNGGTQPQTLQIVLNTSGAAWTLNYYDGATNVNTYTYTTNPTITAVSFGDSNAVGSVSNFSLTATPVPAPATLGLVAIGGMALLLLKRRRQV